MRARGRDALKAQTSKQGASTAALLFATNTASASGTAADRAASAPAARWPRPPVARSNSTGVFPAASINASTAAADSGARPRLVCTTTPVALRTRPSCERDAGKAAAAASAASSGASAPSRTRRNADPTASRTTSRPSRPIPACKRGSAITASTRGVARRESTTYPESKLEDKMRARAEVHGNRTRLAEQARPRRF